MNVESLSNLIVNSGIDLSDEVRGIVSGKSLSSLGILWGKTLAMTAKEKNQVRSGN